jgi:hypothetical protein
MNLISRGASVAVAVTSEAFNVRHTIIAGGKSQITQAG